MKQFGYIAILAVGMAGCTTGKNETADVPTTEIIQYECEGGTIIRVQYDNSKEESVAYVQLRPENPEKIKMTISPSGSGARYTDGKLVWWTKGNTAFLSDDEGGETIYSDCNEFTASE